MNADLFVHFADIGSTFAYSRRIAVLLDTGAPKVHFYVDDPPLRLLADGIPDAINCRSRHELMKMPTITFTFYQGGAQQNAGLAGLEDYLHTVA